MYRLSIFFYFFFNDTATTEIYTLSLHDALPISLATIDSLAEADLLCDSDAEASDSLAKDLDVDKLAETSSRSEEHTSELQSRQYLVCRLLLEKKTNIR